MVLRGQTNVILCEPDLATGPSIVDQFEVLILVNLVTQRLSKVDYQ